MAVWDVDAASPPAGWYADPYWAGALRYWTGTMWSEVTSPAAASAMPGFWPTVPQPGLLAEREREMNRRCGAVTLTLGVIVLLIATVLGAVAISDYSEYTQAVPVAARITEIDDGWCTYDWEGAPERDADLAEDTCPDGAEVGDTVDIVVDPYGGAWTSQDSMTDPDLGIVAVRNLLRGAALIVAGSWLLRAPRDEGSLDSGTSRG